MPKLRQEFKRGNRPLADLRIYQVVEPRFQDFAFLSFLSPTFHLTLRSAQKFVKHFIAVYQAVIHLRGEKVKIP